MLKKLLAVLLSVAMLTGLVTVPAFAAETETFVQDFSEIPDMEATGGADLTNYGGGSLTAVYTAKGISGKAADDRSVVTTVAVASGSSASYFKKNHTLYGRNTISYNVMIPNRTQYANAMYMADQKILNIRPDDNSSRYGIMVNWNVNHDFEVGKWYNIAIDMNLSSEDVDGMTARTYDIYVNGVKYYSSIAVPAAIVDGANIDFRFGSVIGGHIDDIQIVSGGYDATKAAVTIASVAGGSANETAKTIAVTGMNVSDVATAVVPSEGATVLGVVDPASFTAKTEGELADGDLVVVLAADGVTYNYYKIGIVATEDFSQDFSSAPDKDTAGDADLTNYGGGSLVNAYTAKGVAGKSADDRSVVTTVSEASAASASYFRKNHTLYGRNTISYNLYFPNRSAYINAMYIANQKMLYIRPDDNSSRYGIMVSWNVNHDTEIGKWYNIAIDMNLSTTEIDGMAGRTYDIYVNGVKYYSSIAVPSAIKEGVSMDFRFGGSKDGYIDDIQIVGGGYTPAEAAVLTGASGVGVDNENNTLTFSNASVADLTSLVSSQNASVEGVLDVETHMTKTSGNIEVGDLVAVRLADNTYVYYEVVSGATVVSAGDYTFDNNAKTITNVYYNTSVEAFKNAVVLADNTIEKVVKDGDKEVTTGTVKNGMTLNVGGNVYAISLRTAYADDDFTGLNGTRVSDWANGSGQAMTAGITLTYNGLSFNNETGEGSFYEIVEEDGNEVLMLYAQNPSSAAFFGDSVSSGITSANVMEFSIKKPDKKTSSKVYFYGSKESTKDMASVWDQVNATPVNFETDGMIYFNGESLFEYKLNEWYRVVIVTDIPNNKMTLYLNGVKAAEKVFEDPLVRIFRFRLESYIIPEESIVYYDDIKWYDFDSTIDFYDEEKIAALTTESSNVTIETGAAFGTFETTLTTVEAVLNAVKPTGTMKAYDAYGEEIIDTTVAPAHGMYIEVTSIDGLAKAKYTYVVDSISDIFFDVEGNETINRIINAKIHIVNSDEENTEVGKLFIAKYEGSKLVGVNFAKVDARCTAGGYVDKVFSASIDVTDSTKESVKAFYFGANGVKPLKGDKELSVSSTNF
ncbi:MAG: hypothetical protein J6B23_06700 [Clostridia bacterium]|nr:hypothetical protein [Clostridia bacterium]